MGKLRIPLIATNRINTPEKAEELLRDGFADLVSMARPFLADPDFMLKARNGRAQEINTCIACNQACLDQIFRGKTAGCLVNPGACREHWQQNLPPLAGNKQGKIAVVGAGPAGLSAAGELAAQGREVHLFEAAGEIGGQFNLAKQIPGKEEFHETLRYFSQMLQKHGVNVHLNTRVSAAYLIEHQFNEVVLATGVTPRTPRIQGIEHPKVISYLEVLTRQKTVGKTVAIIGAGGIGFDVATYLTAPEKPQDVVEAYRKEWGIDPDFSHRGGIGAPENAPSPRQVWLLQRSKGKVGERLGKTTGWAHRLTLKHRNVQMWNEVEYLGIDDAGLHLRVKGETRLLEVENVVICAGQESLRELYEPLEAAGIRVHLIGGAKEAGELDAKRAIEEGWLLAREAKL
jgi:2,4-dienoyl-CoA reductase (NADPH2)